MTPEQIKELANSVLRPLTEISKHGAWEVVPSSMTFDEMSVLIQQAIIQAINMTKDEDAEICEKIGDQVEYDRPNKYMGDSALDAAESILSSKIKET